MFKTPFFLHMPPCTIILLCAHNNLQGVILQETESSDNTNMKTSNITTLKLLSNFSPQFKATLPAHSPVYSDAGGKVSILGADRIGHYKKKKFI